MAHNVQSVQITVNRAQSQLVQSAQMDITLKIQLALNANLNALHVQEKILAQNVHSDIIWIQHNNANNVLQIVKPVVQQDVLNVPIIHSHQHQDFVSVQELSITILAFHVHKIVSNVVHQPIVYNVIRDTNQPQIFVKQIAQFKLIPHHVILLTQQFQIHKRKIVLQVLLQDLLLGLQQEYQYWQEYYITWEKNYQHQQSIL